MMYVGVHTPRYFIHNHVNFFRKGSYLLIPPKIIDLFTPVKYNFAFKGYDWSLSYKSSYLSGHMSKMCQKFNINQKNDLQYCTFFIVYPLSFFNLHRDLLSYFFWVLNHYH